VAARTRSSWTTEMPPLTGNGGWLDGSSLVGQSSQPGDTVYGRDVRSVGWSCFTPWYDGSV
jgi:hypothetical protein